MQPGRTNFRVMLALAVLALLAPSARAGAVAGPATAAEGAAGDHATIAKEARKHMEHNRTVFLTTSQEALRHRALAPLPAPCCSEFSMATCCCECNLSRSIWGVSKLAATRAGATEETVRDSVLAWIRAINPSGYTGDVCATGGCGRPFTEGGCGGMDENELVLP